MGRRALGKIDPDLDLTGYLSTADELPDSWTSRTLFGRDGRLQLEVGSGKGLFLAAASRGQPEVHFLGIEVSRKYARFAAAKLARAGGANARIVHGEAAQLIRTRVPNGSIEAVHVYFPDPWWKKRHRKRRIMSEPFVADIQRVLVPGGVLHFWTDVEPYFLATVALITGTTQLDGPLPVPPRPAQHDMDYRTHFERRVRLSQQTVHRATFHKPAAGPANDAADHGQAGWSTSSRS